MMNQTNHTERFTANGLRFRTTKQVLDLMAEFREANNQYMVSVVFSIAKEFGQLTLEVTQ